MGVIQEHKKFVEDTSFRDLINRIYVWDRKVPKANFMKWYGKYNTGGCLN